MEKENWYNLTAEETAKKLETDLKQGLSDAEVSARREKYGTNELKAKRKQTLIEKFLAEAKFDDADILEIHNFIDYMKFRQTTNNTVKIRKRLFQ